MIRKKYKNKVSELIKKYILVTIGAILASIGLELFLIPNHVIDGGVVGISIMLEHITGMSLSMFLVLLNIPFAILGWKQIGFRFSVCGSISIVLLAVFSELVGHHFEPITNDAFLASIFGGIIDGLGVGLIIKAGGFLDGTNVVSIIMDRKSVFSVGEVEMFINFFILSSAGFLFGWDKAMYSLFAYYIISKSIDVAVKGLNESYTVMIITNEYENVKTALFEKMNRGVTIIYGEGGYSGQETKILYTIVTRFEVDEMKEIIADIDDKAFITINSITDVVGGKFNTKSTH